MCCYSVFGTTVCAGILLNTELLYVRAGLPYLYVCAGIGARVPFSTESSSNGLSGGP